VTDTVIHYAGFWRRLGAFALDAVLYTAFTTLPLLAIAFCWVRWGATPGKWLLDCQVVDARTLQPLTWKQAGLRLLGYLVSAMLLYLGFLWIAFDRRKQGLHDKLVGSVVLHRSPDYAAPGSGIPAQAGDPAGQGDRHRTARHRPRPLSLPAR